MLQFIRTRVVIATISILAGVTPLPAQETVDHGLYDQALRHYVQNGRVDYDGFASDSGFARYLASLDRIDPSLLSQEERIAFWLNVYNAYTIRLITESGERQSIRNVHKTFGVLRLKGPWTTPVVHAGGRTLSLEQVHHTMLRRETSDARIHFALSCAAVSCPPIREEAYTGAKLEQQLQDQARRFLTNDTLNRFEVKERTFYQNLIFRNFRQDFGNTWRELGNFVAQWYTDSAAKRMLIDGRYQVSVLPFDWSLNVIPRDSVTRR